MTKRSGEEQLAMTADAGRLESERRLEIATRAAAIGVWDWNLSDNSFVYSDTARQICGFSSDQPITLELLRAITHPDDLPLTSAQARAATDPQVRDSRVYRYRIRRADTGEQRWILAYGEATFADVEGVTRALRYTGTIQDITDQKRAEEALAESEARLRLTVDAAQMAVWEVDVASGAVTHSPQLNLLCGFPPDARPTLEEFRSRYAPGERERLEQESAAIRERGGTQMQTEYRQLWPDGSEHWMLLRAAFAPGDSGSSRVLGVLIDITDSKRAEARTALVARELQHRMKNALTIVQTIARQTFRDASDPAAAVDAFIGRLQALAAATDIVTLNDWTDGSICAVVEQITLPFRDVGLDPFVTEGKDRLLPSKVAIGLGMALHELCTNAAKYGALSSPEGRVRLRWEVEEAGRLSVTWQEVDGPPVVVPDRRGFGSRLLERGLFVEPEGRVQIDFLPEGVLARIIVNL
ncbi:MAG TPA: HWE histidine kinase domain-containing protein [Devosiaceae bacterium]|nr:HWE histidine kinase domain-containing protein [Devosiaceae bacterium]